MTIKIDFASFKQEINLTQYAAYLGYEIDRKKSTLNSIAMRRGHEDKIIISKRKGSWIYFSVYDDRDNGTIIDFVKNRTNKSLFEIGKELHIWIGGNVALPETAKYVHHVEEKKPDPLRIQRLYNYCSPAFNHEYLNSRGIIAEALKSPRFSGRHRSGPLSEGVPGSFLRRGNRRAARGHFCGGPGHRGLFLKPFQADTFGEAQPRSMQTHPKIRG